MVKDKKKVLNYNINFTEKINYIKDSIISCGKVKYIYLFGSFAYGNPDKYSDIDLYIVFYGKEAYSPYLYADIMEKLSKKNLFYVDMIMYEENDFNKRKDFTLERKILKEGKLIYEN
jgi:predicted nucleotidyltransferase